MDDLEEFLNVFFQECEERLGELQDNLALMVDGNWDAETLNAAFRAVHSVKGGAGAFALDALVEFTHIFETTMDALRSNKLEPNPQVCQVLLRASDMMSALIESAQGNGVPDRAKAERIMAELHSLAETGTLDHVAASVAAIAGEKKSFDESTQELVEDEEDFEEDTCEVLVDLRPGPDFVRSGHDPLKVVRALRKFGWGRVECYGDLQPIDDHDPLDIQLSWKVTINTESTVEDIDLFVEIYRMTADVLVKEIIVDSAAAVPAEAQAEKVDPAPSVQKAPEEEPATAPAPSAKSPALETASVSAHKPASKRDAGSAQQQRVAKALRVELSRIDRLVNMVGEIVITQAVLSQNFSELEGVTDVECVHAVESLSRQVRELQESVMAIRAQPVKSVFSRMPRIVRDLASDLDKEVRLVLSGEHTEVDTTVIEELAEPLTHMLRNSMDHGIEMPDKREAAEKPREGTIHLSAEHRGERVRIILQDDGAGINREKVFNKAVANGIVPPDATLNDEEIDMLIFHPGFSTADEVTNVSGRGVGMDVVKKKVQALGGRVALINSPAKGAQFIITLPLTLAVLDGMTVGVGAERFILPLGSIVEAVKLDSGNVDHLPGEVTVLRYRGDWLPMICLRQTLNLDIPPGDEDLVVVVETETDGRIAIVVDELLGQRQVVLKSLEANFRRVEGVSGATILGDGRVALILDIPTLQAMSGGGLGSSSQMLQEFTL
jgi:two-component system chemotaxis sensor kinase CheA